MSEAQREAAALAAERARDRGRGASPRASSPGVAAFGSVVDSWRSAVAAKAAEAERLRGSLSELLVSQTHAARLRKEAEARAAELETERRDAEIAFESRLAALRQALGAAESARADADADVETYKRALVAAKEDCERLELEAAVSKHKNDEGTQAKLLIVQAESSELRAKVEKRNREVRELNQMLKAWEAMRHSKDAQIEKLVERCKKFEDEATEKARAIESMRKASRLGSGHKRDGFPSSGRESSRRVALAPAVAAADKENQRGRRAPRNWRRRSRVKARTGKKARCRPRPRRSRRSSASHTSRGRTPCRGSGKGWTRWSGGDRGEIPYSSRRGGFIIDTFRHEPLGDDSRAPDTPIPDRVAMTSTDDDGCTLGFVRDLAQADRPHATGRGAIGCPRWRRRRACPCVGAPPRRASRRA